MKNIINKIKNFTLEQFNKNLLLIALASLLFRNGNFAGSYMPKPFEIILVLLCVLTLFDIIKNKKVKEFFLSIPKNIWYSGCCLVFSILIGWGIAVFVKGIPATLNNVLEFGSFGIGLTTFFLILFYTKNDPIYTKRYFYMLLIPIVYIICVIFPPLAKYFDLITYGNHFIGFTTNPNIFSKILIIPIIYCVSLILFKSKNKWLKVIYFLFASLLISLLFWATSRGTLLSVIIGLILMCFLFLSNNFNFKKLVQCVFIIIGIFFIGFTITSHNTKSLVLDRIPNPEIIQISQLQFQNELPIKIPQPLPVKDKYSEPRFQIWNFYLNKLLMNPLGLGPNTHLSFGLKDNNGEYINSGPHNTFLEIWLWGGLLGLFSFIYILILALKNLKIKLQNDFNPRVLSLICIFFALLISMMFDDCLSFYWFFIILALSFRI